MKFQKLTAGLLALSMLCMPSAGAVQMLTAAAEEIAPTSGTLGALNWSFAESTGTLTISGEGEMDQGESDTYPWSDFRDEIQTVVIEDGVTSIGEEAFAHSSLTSVTIPDSVTSIGYGAFYLCGELTSVAIPDSVTSIGYWAFSNCTNLTSVTIPDGVTNIGDYTFLNCENLTAVTIPDSVTSIECGAFEFCGNLTSVTIPGNVTSIGKLAFSCCKNLTEITIQNPDCGICDDASTISNDHDDDNGNDSFTGTIRGYEGSTAQSYAEKYGYTFESLGKFQDTPSSITSGTCGKNLTWVFNKNAGKLIISGEGEMKRGENLYYPWFDFRDDIRYVTIENGVTSIGVNAFFDCTSLTQINIPYSVTSIGNNAFSGCTALTTVTIPDSVTSIGVAAFAYCWDLTKITIKNPDCQISDFASTISNARDENGKDYYTGKIRGYENSTAQRYALQFGCTFDVIEDAPTSGTCGENVTWTYDESTGTLTFSGTGEMYRDESFYDNDGYTWEHLRNAIQTVVIEDGVTNIVSGAFSHCRKLSSVTIPDSVTSIERQAFQWCQSLTSVTIPDSVTSIGQSAFANSDLTTVVIPDSAVIGQGAFSNTPWLLAKQAEDPFVIVNGILIDASACSGDVTIPDGVTSIGELAFDGEIQNTALTSVIIPDSVTSIEDYAFYSCVNLTSVSIPDSVTSIGHTAFYGCENLTSVNIPDSVTIIETALFAGCKNLTSITIPDSVKTIKSKAFTDSGLTSVTVPGNVTLIEMEAFEGCKNLTEITFLNPYCQIYDISSTISNGLDLDAAKYNYTGTIRGYDNSSAQKYAEKYGYTFVSLGEAPESFTLALGDINGDKMIDASDAADLLLALANIGVGEDCGLTAAQEKAADVDGNGTLDAGDAAVIMEYAALMGSGGTVTIEEFQLSAVWHG